MIHALVTQMLNALEHHQSQTRPIHKTEFAITEAREYLATEPSGERAELIANLRSQECCQAHGGAGSHHTRCKECPRNVADMLEADAQQAKRVPMTGEEIEKIADGCRAGAGSVWPHAFARAIEAHHGITPEDKPTGWSAA